MSEPKANASNITIENKKLSDIIFYLILLFLPTQFGKHFWPVFSIVSGIRVDYLSPTVYFTDILILFLLLTLVVNRFSSFKKFSIHNFQFSIKSKFSMFKFFKIKNSIKIFLRSRILLRKTNISSKGRSAFGRKFPILRIGSYWMLVILVLFLLFGVILSEAPSAGFYGLLKFGEFLFLGIYVSRSIDNLKQFKTICLVFSAGVVLESGLAVAQFFNQSSLNGFFYFLGERTFTSQTPGIANASLNGELVLRPYGTFSHPNVLAGYLVITMTMIVLCIKYYVLSIKKTLLYSSLGLGSIALFLTMSRVAIVLWIILLASYFFFNIKNKFNIYYLIFTILIIFSISFSPIRYRFLDINRLDESVIEREQLVVESIKVFKQNPVIGVGLNNYLNTFYLQPVHNIYLLVLAQTGVFGFLFFLWFLCLTVRKISNISSRGRLASGQKFQISNFKFQILLIILVLGLFDHYFLTLQQGQILFAFVFGFLWSRFLFPLL